MASVLMTQCDLTPSTVVCTKIQGCCLLCTKTTEKYCHREMMCDHIRCDTIPIRIDAPPLVGRNVDICPNNEQKRAFRDHESYLYWCFIPGLSLAVCCHHKFLWQLSKPLENYIGQLFPVTHAWLKGRLAAVHNGGKNCEMARKQ